MASQDLTGTAAHEASSAAASYSRHQRAPACGVRHNFQIDIHLSGHKKTILCQLEHKKISPHPKKPRLKKHFIISRNLMYLLDAAINTESDISGIPSMHSTEHSRTSRPGSRVSEQLPLYPSCVHLPEWAVSQAIATGVLEARKIMKERTRRIGQAWAVIYFTDQLLTLRSKYFSGASILNGTPGGDRWARVFGEQIGWLLEPLHRFHADCSGSRNLKMQTNGKHEKSRPMGITPRNPHQPSDRDHL